MKIKLERIINEKDELVFTMTCSDPVQVLNEEDKEKLDILKDVISYIHDRYEVNDDYIISLKNRLNDAVYDVYCTYLNSIVYVLDNVLINKKQNIVSEIMNWCHDRQKDNIADLINQFRTLKEKYYFDNDKTIESDTEYD